MLVLPLDTCAFTPSLFHAPALLPLSCVCAVHAALLDPANGYPAAEVAEAVRHTPAQVRTLLGVV